MKDLILLAADKNTQFALKGALCRHEALAIRPIQFEFRVHPGRDGGMRKSGPEMLALERSRFQHGLLVFDFEGSGTDCADALELERHLDARIKPHWHDRAKTIVIAPEVDVWMWGSDNALRNAFQWSGGPIRNWLREQQFEIDEYEKPLRPKEAIETILRRGKVQRSSALYEEIASKISLRHCVDPAFQRMLQQLRIWFPPPPT